MAVAAIVAIRHHEEQLRIIHQGEEAEQVEGNTDIYEEALQAKAAKEKKHLHNPLWRAFTQCCTSAGKVRMTVFVYACVCMHMCCVCMCVFVCLFFPPQLILTLTTPFP